MSSINSNGIRDPRENKASSLTDSMSAPAEAPAAPIVGKEVLQDSPTADNKRKWLVVLMDVILFVALIGFLVGGWFGYNALRDAYAPSWETRNIVLVVELPHVDPALIPAMGNAGERYVYNTEKTGVPALGTVMDMVVTDYIDYAPETDASGGTSADEGSEGVENDKAYKTVRLIISVKAKYQKDKGYYVNSLPVLAGDVNLYRFKGMAAEGTVLSLYEKEEYESMSEVDAETDAASTASN